MTNQKSKIIEQHHLTQKEYDSIVTALGREPNLVELGIFSVMWSEHCCYKSSKIYLKNFPTTGPHVLQGPGENAGIIDIGDGTAIAFKIESHNHPSFIEPYQGAATGVGGILRDIFTMGARPIASLNSLHFGSPDHPLTPHLVKGVVAGIGGYGNCVGVPTVGGETHFDERYNGNILVNAFTLGVLPARKIFKGIAKGIGNPVILVGSKTGRDGIHGATMASDVFDAASESKRPTVQVGDPFTEKKLLEACLEVFQLDGAIVGIQDMGAAGFTCSSFEMSSRGGVGMELWLDKIPQREAKMTPYEIMLSESQERMLLVAARGREKELEKIFRKWELEFAVVGEVILEKRVCGIFHGEAVFDLPVVPVTEGAPVYERPVAERPTSNNQRPNKSEIPKPKLQTKEMLLQLLASPNICSKKWIYRQYDSMVGTNTILGPGSDAACVRIKENGRIVAMTVDSNSRWCALHPYQGAAYTVAEGVRNLACVGASPVGLTDCLNFGNPENPEVMWQFSETCKGIAEACLQFEIPVVGGNVSLYNETDGRSIPPTPTIAMVGLLPSGLLPMTPHWKEEGDLVYLIGDVACSEALFSVDFEKEKAKARLCRLAIEQHWLRSAHDVSEGGLAVALAECSFLPGGKSLGVLIEALDADVVTLFGENPAPIVVSLDPKKEKKFLQLAEKINYPVKKIGTTGGTKLFDVEVSGLREAYSNFAF